MQCGTDAYDGERSVFITNAFAEYALGMDMLVTVDHQVDFMLDHLIEKRRRIEQSDPSGIFGVIRNRQRMVMQRNNLVGAIEIVGMRLSGLVVFRVKARQIGRQNITVGSDAALSRRIESINPHAFRRIKRSRRRLPEKPLVVGIGESQIAFEITDVMISRHDDQSCGAVVSTRAKLL